MLYRQNLLAGALFVVLSELCFASMGAVVKHLSFGLPSEMLVFARNFFALLFLAPLLAHNRVPLATALFPWHLARALIGLSAMYCFFFALGQLPLAEGMLLKMTSPLFMPLVALLLLGERAPRLALVAVPVGFLGVALVLRPSEGFNLFAVLAVAGGALAATAKVSVRRLTRSEPILRVVFYFALIASGVSLVPVLWSWQTPAPGEWGLLVSLGLLGTLGQLFLTRGYAVAGAARVSPLTYFSVVFGTAWGYLLWGETIDWVFEFGALLIVAAGILALWRDKRAPVSAALEST
ncbi:MAG: DMT family transporter [Gammaproteobacteria bacterium]|nr:DMT family transporter [Gammaproteobacteria bacterium]